MNSTATRKNRPVVGQTVRWIEPYEYKGNVTFLEKRKEEYKGELKILSLEDRPLRGDGFFFVTISHNGSPIMSNGDVAIFDPIWFHWEGE